MQSVVFAHHLICTLRVSPLCGNNSEVAVTFPLVLVTRFMIWENQMHDEFLLQNEVLANAAWVQSCSWLASRMQLFKNCVCPLTASQVTCTIHVIWATFHTACYGSGNWIEWSVESNLRAHICAAFSGGIIGIIMPMISGVIMPPLSFKWSQKVEHSCNSVWGNTFGWGIHPCCEEIRVATANRQWTLGYRRCRPKAGKQGEFS